MASKHKSLQGQLLLDGGKLAGSFFHRSVVLICQHDEDGAFGLILNRATDNIVGEALVADLPDAIKEQFLFAGGPVQPDSLTYLHSDALVPEPSIMPHLAMGHSLDALVDLTENTSPGLKLKLFAGYSGWGAGQLDNEMAREDWLVHPASLELVFFAEPAKLWSEILRRRKDAARLMADAPDDLSWN
jgi:putative transcriptional regulator